MATKTTQQASTLELPAELKTALVAADAAVQAVQAARAAIEQGRLERPTLAAELNLFAAEVRRLEELARPGLRTDAPKAIVAALRRRRNGAAELQKLAALDRERCDALEQAAARAGVAHDGLVTAIAGAASELASSPAVAGAVDRLMRRLRESVALQLVGGMRGDFEEVEFTREAVFNEASAADLGGLADLRQAVQSCRSASMRGDAPEWPAFEYEAVERPLRRAWLREDQAANGNAAAMSGASQTVHEAARV